MKCKRYIFRCLLFALLALLSVSGKIRTVQTKSSPVSHAKASAFANKNAKPSDCEADGPETANPPIHRAILASKTKTPTIEPPSSNFQPQEPEKPKPERTPSSTGMGETTNILIRFMILWSIIYIIIKLVRL